MIRTDVVRTPTMRPAILHGLLDRAFEAPAEPDCHLTLVVPLEGVLQPLPRRTNIKAILEVLGSETLRIQQVVERLRSRNLLPGGKNPAKTVGTVLAQRNDVFRRVRRGFYRARK